MAEQVLEAGEVLKGSAFTRRFFPKLPPMVRADIKRKVSARMKRANPTKQNLIKAAEEAVKFGLKRAAFIEDKYSFVDSRYKAKAEPISHDILMRDDAVEKLSKVYADKCSMLLSDESLAEKFSSYLEALEHIYHQQSEQLRLIHVNPPHINFKKREKKPDELERDLEIAALKMQSEEWIEGRLLQLRAQYIEYSQIALERVGEYQHQSPIISAMSFSNWKRNQHEASKFIEAMAILNNDSGEVYDLAEVVKRTTANPENRRIEMMVRCRGFEEWAQDLGFTALFITWTLPSKYHRISSKWNGSSVKDGHNALMHKWALARALIAKTDIEYFAFVSPNLIKMQPAMLTIFCFVLIRIKMKSYRY